MQDMHVKFYIPAEPAGPLEAVVYHLIEGCGGLTSTAGIGQWYSPTQDAYIKEAVQVLEVYLEDTPDNRLWIESVALEYKDAAEQECVLYAINNQPTFLED